MRWASRSSTTESGGYDGPIAAPCVRARCSRHADLADYWHEFKLPSIASWKAQRPHLNLHLVPFFGSMWLRFSSVEEVRRLAVHIKHRRGGRRGGKPLSDKTIRSIQHCVMPFFEYA